jgi:hypothetical protein
MPNTKTRYLGVFSNEIVTRRESARTYAFAWLVQLPNPNNWGGPTVTSWSGFAATRQGAEKEVARLSRFHAPLFAEIVLVTVGIK